MYIKVLPTVFHALLPALLFVPVGALFAPDGKLDATRVPWILLVTQFLLLAWVAFLMRRWRPTLDDLGLRVRPGTTRIILFGMGAGAFLALGYEVALSPALDWLRTHVGDVVPPGETRRALGSAVVPFVLANVFLAPFVEELLFRGLLDWRFRALWGPRVAAVVGVVAFGLLHWAGGVFYIAATAAIGAGFLTYRRRCGSLLGSIAGHLAFNTLEVLLFLVR